MCNKVRDLVYFDRQIKVEEIANALHFSHSSVLTTLHDRLCMHKLTACWVPKSFSDEQMTPRASVYNALLKRFRLEEDDFLSCLVTVRSKEDESPEFLSRLVTVDENWVHYYEPENKAQSRQLIPHPAYFPDLTLSDYFLFPNLKKDIHGRHFRSNEEVVAAVEERVRDKDSGFFSSGLISLEHRWSKCIILEGNYIKKEEIDLIQK